MTHEDLPEIVRSLAHDHPLVWEAYNKLGEAVGGAGPLDDRSERLVKLAIAVGGRLEGATRSHVRRALWAGVTPEEIEHVVLLSITTIGWPSAVAALSWAREEIAKKS